MTFLTSCLALSGKLCSRKSREKCNFFPELTYAFTALGKDFGRDGKEVFLSSGASMYRTLL